MTEQTLAQCEVQMFFKLSRAATDLMRGGPAPLDVDELRDEVDLLAEMTEQNALRAQALRLIDRLDGWRVAAN